jgi:hypothetical protein
MRDVKAFLMWSFFVVGILISLCLVACSTPGTKPSPSRCISSCNEAWSLCSNREDTAKVICKENATDQLERRLCRNKYHPRFKALTCGMDEAFCIDNCNE